MMRPSLPALCAAAAALSLTTLAAPVVAAAPEADPHHAQPQGALSGATVYVSAGHGWLYNAERGTWNTQRGNSYGVIEDHSNAEAINQYFIRYLWNAGANVVTTRERDMQTNMVIVEAGSPGYSEEGEWETEYLFGARDGSQRIARTASARRESRHASATFTPDIPETGHYAVYAWYTPAGAGRTSTDARYIIRHSGGETIWTQDQNHDGFTWRYMGTYHFEEGAGPDRASVTLSNVSDAGGRTHVVADAIRFGGGMGDIPHNEDSGVSGHPRWEESGYYYAQFMTKNIRETTRSYGSVTAMPLFSEWSAEPHQKDRSIYLSWHTNASRGTARGLFSFVYSGTAWAGLDAGTFAGFPGGDHLGVAAHEGILDAVHTDWDPDWRDGGVIAWWLGETNPRNNTKMPMALVEVGFHDNPEDAAYILDPRFRDLASRGLYHGVVDYFVAHGDGFSNTTYLPSPPTHLSAITNDDGTVTLSWQAPEHDPEKRRAMGDPATGYRVYRSPNGEGFDGGFAVEDTTVTFPVDPYRMTFFRVAATNEGGESFPSETLGVLSDGGAPYPILLVNGFHRLDRGLNLRFEDPRRDYDVERGIIAKMNTRNYVAHHGRALELLGHRFDSASSLAVEAGSVHLDDYSAVIWMLGQENAESGALTSVQQDRLLDYLGAGGKLFVSGNHAASALSASPVGRAFLTGALGAELAATTSDPRTLRGTSDGPFSMFRTLPFGSLEESVYPIREADVLRAGSSGRLAMEYADGGGAAVVTADTVLLSAPFETVETVAGRARLMRETLRHLAPRVPEPVEPATDESVASVIP